MKKIAVISGIVLVVVGLIGYGLPSVEVMEDGEVVDKERSLTALIPAAFGVLIFLCGLLAWLNPRASKMAMHVAASIALLGALAASAMGVSRLISFIRADDDFNGRAFVFVALLAVICWMFVVACVASFIKARQAREAGDGVATDVSPGD